jgi:hypothetical protein
MKERVCGRFLWQVLSSFTVVASDPLDCYNGIGLTSLYDVCPSFPMWINTKNDTYIEKVYNAFKPVTFVNTFTMMQFLVSACYTLSASHSTHSANTPPASCKMQVDSLGGSSLYYSVPASSCNLDGGGSRLGLLSDCVDDTVGPFNPPPFLT